MGWELMIPISCVLFVHMTMFHLGSHYIHADANYRVRVSLVSQETLLVRKTDGRKKEKEKVMLKNVNGSKHPEKH